MHVRRALLLFAIVLGMAALAASLSRPSDDGDRNKPRQPGPPTTGQAPTQAPAKALAFDAGLNESRRVAAGRAATVEVAVDEPGSVEIPRMGLRADADQATPARFDVLPANSGDYEIVFVPADGDQREPAGTLVVTLEG